MSDFFMWMLVLTLSVLLGFTPATHAQTRWELIGPVTGATPTTLPPPTPPGTILRMTEGGATDALVTANGTDWNCDAARTQQIAIVTCPPYNAAGNGSTDDTAALQTALLAHDTVFPAGTYLISATLTVPSNRRLSGAKGAILKLANQAVAPMVYFTGATTNVTIEGLTFDGNQANQTGCGGGCRGIVGTGSPTRIRLLNNTVTNIRNDGIYLSGVTHSMISGNYVGQILGEDTYGSGITVAAPTAGNQFVTITGNVLEQIGGGGIVVTGRDIVIANNVINDTAKTITAQAILVGYIDALRVTVANNSIHTTTWHGCIRMGGSFLTAIGNTVYNCGERGIVGMTTNDGSARGYHIRILDNTVINPTEDGGASGAPGIQIGACDYCEVATNHVRLLSTSPYTGIVVNDNVHSQVTNNLIENGNNCIRLSTLTWTQVAGNVCTGQTVWGIILLTPPTAHLTVAHNQIGPLVSGAFGGIVLDDGSATDVSIVGNTVVDVPSATTITGPHGAWAASNYAPEADCTVPAAATLSLNGAQIACDQLQIDGTTPITAMTVGAKHRLLTLRFSGATTVTDGGNLKLAGNFVTTPDDVLVVQSDGTNWIEMNRSAN
jgi:parallel beta-helix repeat protein